MITPLEYSKLNEQKITFLKPCQSGYIETQIELNNFDNIYANKKLLIKTDKGVYLSGILIISENEGEIGYSLRFDNGYVTIGDEWDLDGYYRETFFNENSEDNKILSFSQLKNKLNSTENKLNSEGQLIEEGSKGLIDGNEKNKLTQLKTEKYKNQIIDVNTLTTTKIGNVIIPNFYSNNKIQNFYHVFSIVGKNFNCKIKISLSNFDNEIGQYQIDVLNYSSSTLLKNLSLVLNLSKKTVSSVNKVFLCIDAKFDKSKVVGIIPTTDLTYKIIHETSDINNIFLNNYGLGLITNDLSLQYIKPDNTLSYNFIIDSNILKYTNNKIIYLNETNKPIRINPNTNLDDFIIPGKYYTIINENFSSIQNKPILNNKKFALEVIDFNIEKTLNKIDLLQRYTCFDYIGNSTNYQISVFERVSNSDNVFLWSPWIEVGKKIHTHSVNDIIETTTKKFVSQADINNWNSVLSATALSTWKPPVSTYNSLLQTYVSPQNGWSVFVFETSSIWIYNNGIWTNKTPICNIDENGLVSKEQFLEYFEGAGISKKIRSKESFINRLTESPEIIYGLNYTNINEFHIDEVKRISPITNILKEYVIQRGWNVNIYGSDSFVTGKDINSIENNSIGIGVGLSYDSADQTIFGKYNEIDGNLGFIIGNGTSDIDRNNLFSISKSGTVKANGFSTPLGTVNDFLLANGSTQSKTSLIQSIFNDLAIAGKEIVTVTTNVEEFTINWTTTRKTNYGLFGNFEVWSEVGTNVYEKQEVPVRLITEINLDNNLQAVSYTFTLSQINAIIIIK